jgi:hypothetical protein
MLADKDHCYNCKFVFVDLNKWRHKLYICRHPALEHKNRPQNIGVVTWILLCYKYKLKILKRKRVRTVRKL